MFLKTLRNSSYIWRRQMPMLGWIVDFYCPSEKLIIEVDGAYHQNPDQQVKDAIRDSVIRRRLGFKTVRFTNEQILQNMPMVESKIWDLLLTSAPRERDLRAAIKDWSL
jgi:very-short-patch-repair endonuclease